MKKEMLINVLQPEEIRIAIVEDGVLEELYVERSSHESYVGNIYKGRIVNIEPSIQAAFVDFGVGRNGFLHVSDVEPAYYRHLAGYQDDDRGGRRTPRDRHRAGGGRSESRGRSDGRRRPEGRGRRSRPMRDDVPPLPEELLDDLHEAPLEAPHHAPHDEGAPPAEAFGEPPAADDALPDRQAADAWDEAAEDSEALDALSSPADELANDDAAAADDLSGRGEGLATAEDEPGAEPAEEPRRRGRRRRGNRSRRPRNGAEPGHESTSEAGAEAGPAPAQAPRDAAPPREDEPLRPLDDERPRLMDSAERRTEETDEPAEPVESSSTLRDEDLSFSMAPAPAHAPAHAASPVPASQVRRDEPAPVAPPRREPEPPVSEGQLPEAMPLADIEHMPLSEERTLPGEPLPADEFAPTADEVPAPADEGDEYPVYEEYAPRDEAPREEPRRDRRDDRRDERRDNRRDNRRDGGRDAGRGGPRRGPGGRPGFGRPKPPIQEIFRRGQEVLVQVIKEGIGTKGPTLSTYISIAGRYLVLMPGLNRIGVSRKIEDDEARRRLRDIMHELHPPRGIGFIIRTAGIDRNRKELQRDLVYLAKLWQVVVRRIKKLKAPADIYQESDMVTRTIRDIFTNDIDTIWVDEKAAYEHAKEFLQIVMPRFAERIKLYEEHEPMFHKYGIEQEITRIQQRHVPLPAGGSIVIDQTEALVAIDVNSGNFRADNSAEETAYRMNLQAAKEIARQLRLRDLGGVIVNDFIDMREERHRRGVERALREAMERDRARTKILRMSQFGIIEMTRQRIRPSLKRSVYQECPHCAGTGHVKTCESMSIEVMRLLQLAAHREYISRLDVSVQDEVAHYLLNRKRQDIAKLEETSGKQIQVRGRLNVAPEFLELVSFDNNGNEVKFLPYDEPAPPRPTRRREGRGRRGRDEDR
ncbi:MAG: Rne/Rng family ribonuclease [Gemmataceae bacterium]|nr:Rne/Rng family ribonuclease [Gemmataceae bacterium]